MTGPGRMPGRSELSPLSQKTSTKLLIVLSFGGQVRPYGAGSGQHDWI